MNLHLNCYFAAKTSSLVYLRLFRAKEKKIFRNYIFEGHLFLDLSKLEIDFLGHVTGQAVTSVE